MPKRKSYTDETDPNIRITRQFPPANTIEERENQIISLAIDRAEQQIRDGTVSAQVLCHYLKLGSTRERIEREMIEKDLELKGAKTEALQSAKHIEELYTNAIAAMRTYSGQDESDEDDLYED